MVTVILLNVGIQVSKRSYTTHQIHLSNCIYPGVTWMMTKSKGCSEMMSVVRIVMRVGVMVVMWCIKIKVKVKVKIMINTSVRVRRCD